MNDSYPDDSKRKAFKPPRRRRRPIRWPSAPRSSTGGGVRDGWLSGLIVGGNRAVAGVGFALVPVLESRFDDASLILVCLLLAGITGGVVFADWWFTRRSPRRELAADLVSLAVLVPASSVARMIAVADSRLGGRDLNYIAAALGVLAVFLIIVSVSLSDESSPPSHSTIGVLPAAILLVALFAGSSAASTANLWQAASLAWIVSAIMTVVYGLAGTSWRSFIAPVSYALFAVVVLTAVDQDSSRRTVSSVHQELSVGILLLVGLILLAMGLWSASMRSIPPGQLAQAQQRSRSSHLDGNR